MTDGGDIVFINTVQYTDEDKEYLSAEEGEMPEVRHAFMSMAVFPTMRVNMLFSDRSSRALMCWRRLRTARWGRKLR